jgi:hypothetical protein
LQRTAAHTGTSTRLAHPTLIVFGRFAAVDAGLPLPINVGFGDRHLDLHRVNPRLLPFLGAPGVGLPVLLRPSYPYERAAGNLPQAFGNVRFDVGLTANHLGAAARTLVAQLQTGTLLLTTLCPSGAWVRPSCTTSAPRCAKHRLVRHREWVDRDEWALADTRRVITASASGNAHRVYGLDPAS